MDTVNNDNDNDANNNNYDNNNNNNNDNNNINNIFLAFTLDSDSGSGQRSHHRCGDNNFPTIRSHKHHLLNYLFYRSGNYTTHFTILAPSHRMCFS